MNAESKVTTEHLKRWAYLYIRQSTLRQVLENTESTQRQYALRRRALALARDGLRNIRSNVRDYKCVMVKRERIGDTLHDYEYMFAKIRNEQTSNGQVVVPFSVYLYFLKPEDMTMKLRPS